MSDFALTQFDRDSALWKRLEAHMREVREDLRAQNEKLIPQPQTDFNRGRLAMLKELIALGDQPSSTP